MIGKKTGTRAVLIIVALAAVAVTLSLRRQARDSGPKDRLVGVKIYGYSGSVPALFEAWRSIGINTAFVSPALASQPEFRELAKKSGVPVFLIFPVFFDADELARRPDLYAVTDKGLRAEDSWVKFACPTRPEYRARKVDELKRLVKETDPDGISLDFIRYFVFWEMVYPHRTLESLPNSCFDASCLASFAAASGVQIPSGLAGTPEVARWILANHPREWTEWKCGVIAGMVKTLADEARRIKPGIRMNLHAVPWRQADFGCAAKAVAGQDLARLAPLVDMISPMCYHHMVKQTPAWVHAVVEDMKRTAGTPVVPSIQVKEAYIPGPETAAEFRAALVEALKPPSAGVIFWNWAALAESPEKLAAARDVLKAEAKTGREVHPWPTSSPSSWPAARAAGSTR
jgi:hypothetical protein